MKRYDDIWRRGAGKLGPAGLMARAAAFLFFVLFASGLLPTGAAQAQAQSQAPSQAAWCAADGGQCVISQPSIVFYGSGAAAIGKYAEYQNVPCTAANFGADPAPGQTKQCNAIPFDQMQPCNPNDPMTPCPPIGNTTLVIYGEGVNWVAKVNKQNSWNIKCSTSSFGVDPSPGYAKSCMYARLPDAGVIASGASSPQPGPAQLYKPIACAANGGACTITQPSIVIFGSGTNIVGGYADSGKVTCSPNVSSKLLFGGPPNDSSSACQAIPFAQFEPCAAQHGVCSNSGTSLFIYGSGTHWVAAFVTGDLHCDVDAFHVPVEGLMGDETCKVFPLASATPVTVGGKPKLGVAAVPGATISQKELSDTIQWLIVETFGISKMPICWKPSYDRGIGIAPNCGSREQLGLLCYDPCNSGFNDNGTPTCLQSHCPSGYTDNGLVCHFNGLALLTRPSHWDSGQNCIPYIGCFGGIAYDSCPDHYSASGAFCDLDLPPGMSGSAADPVKASYTRNGGPMTDCNSNRVFQAGLCYLTPKSGYSCNVTSCAQNCASGTTDCGPAACADNRADCGIAVANMVLGPVQMVATIVTAGTAGPVMVAAKATAEAAEKAGDVLGSGDTLDTAIEQAMNAATTDMADLSSPYAEDQIARKWGRGSANYNTIARTWGGVNLVMVLANTDVNLAKGIASAADPTGAVATITAYANPPCLQHSPIP